MNLTKKSPPGGDGLPRHGTYGRARAPMRCPCPACAAYRRATADYERARKRDARQGVPRTIDAAPTAALIRTLNRHGVSRMVIHRETGVACTVLSAVTSGRRTRILRSTAARIAAVDPETGRRASGTMLVPAAGTARRARALAALGHSFVDVARDAGIGYQHLSEIVNGRRPYVRQDTADAVRRVYDAWSMRLGSNGANRRRAERAGWAPPLAWEYVDIDDPMAEPDGIRGIDDAKSTA